MSWNDADEHYRTVYLPEQRTKEAIREEAERLAAAERKAREEEKKKAFEERAKPRYTGFELQLHQDKPGLALWSRVCDALDHDPEVRAKVAKMIKKGDYLLVGSLAYPAAGCIYYEIPITQVTYKNRDGYDTRYEAHHMARSLDMDPPLHKVYKLTHPDCEGWEVYLEWCNSYWLFWRSWLTIRVRKCTQ